MSCIGQEHCLKGPALFKSFATDEHEMMTLSPIASEFILDQVQTKSHLFHIQGLSDGSIAS